jgi:nitrite reductase (NADH) large subunit
MQSSLLRYVIVGNGVAGVTAAQSIVRADPAAEVHIFGAEPYPYYQRPRLLEFLAGEIEQQTLYFRPLEWYAAKGIQVHLGARVIALDPAEHLLTLADGGSIHYDRLLLATGGRAFVPPFAGADKDGVFTLRTLDDARAIKTYACDEPFDYAQDRRRRTASGVRSATVIGGGLLGLETARALLSLRLDVSVIECKPHLLPRQLDAEGAQVLQARLEALGLHILTDAATETILGTENQNERACSVRLTDGRVVEGDIVLISTGVRSRVELAREAGLEVNRGLIVDEQLRTSAADVYAAGDVAEFACGEPFGFAQDKCRRTEGVVYGIIPAAIEQAQVAAANMVADPSTTLRRGSGQGSGHRPLASSGHRPSASSGHRPSASSGHRPSASSGHGGSATYSGTVPATTLKIVGIDLTCLGEATATGDEYVVLRQVDAVAGVYRRLALRDGKIVGAILLGDTQNVRPLKQLIATGRDVSAYSERLLDENLDLKALAQGLS